MKRQRVLFFVVLVLVCSICFTTCVTNPFSGKRTMAFISNAELFPMAFSGYREFIDENEVVTGTPDAIMIERVGNRIVEAAYKWLAKENALGHLNGYEWEFKLIKDDSINAWAMPGGKIVFYTGILPVTLTEEGVAVVMGHEIAHALLNHGQQRMSAGILQQLGAMAVAAMVSGNSEETQAVIMTAFGVGSTLFGTLPFSRKNEYEADEYGLKLMAIAGYNPEEGAVFWERMSSAGGGSIPAFLSTHPSDTSRISNLRRLIPEAKKFAGTFGVTF